MKIWTCKIGEVDEATLADHNPNGHSADRPMREAVEAAYRMVTGRESVFIFSGWGGRLDEGERAVVEDREPEYVKTEHALRAGAAKARALLQQLSEHPAVMLLGLRKHVCALEVELRDIVAEHPAAIETGDVPAVATPNTRERVLEAALRHLIHVGRPHGIAHDHPTELGRSLAAAQALLDAEEVDAQ